ncbi:MAG TPA: hypothetical protein DCG47_00310, partial [Spirochaetaceae bacterium]|nr:hypothetical protein [Spirochaetaceae bacterium]
DDNFFRLCPSNDAQAKAVALTYKKKNCEKLMLVTSESNAAYVEPYVAMLERHFPGTILQLPFITTEELSRGIDRFKPDGLFNILPAKDLIQVINLIRERGDTFIVGSASWGSTEILSLYSGPALDGVLFFLLGLDELTGSYKAEISSFEERYRMTATNGTFYAVSIMHIIREAVLAVGPSRAALKTWLATPRTYTTAFGSLAMDEFGDSVTGKTLIMQTANGILRQVEYVEDSR